MRNDETTEPIGNDGLTDAERAERAERWRNGAGKAPSREETERLRRLTLSRQVPPEDFSRK